MAPAPTRVLVLYYSRHGSTAALATQVARGINAVDGVTAQVRTVPRSPLKTEGGWAPAVPDSGPPFATHADLQDCDGPGDRQPHAVR